jgi:hypothetical protein
MFENKALKFNNLLSALFVIGPQNKKQLQMARRSIK